MYKLLLNVLIILVLGATSSCKGDEKIKYSIADYPAKLQPVLYDLVNTGIMTFDTAAGFIRYETTDEDLVKLSQCEHPLVRASALNIMLERSGFDHEKIINDHLGDTAVITVDWGEFGIGYQQVADYVIQQGEWKDSAAKAKTIYLVMTQHNQLISAYTILNELNQEPAYYPMIREMAQRTYYQGGEEYGKIGFPEYKHLLIACRALAAYKKPGDIQMIIEQLKKHIWRWTDDVFILMREFPDEKYLDLLEEYFKSYFYDRLCNDQYSLEDATSFIKSVAVYKNKRSADILTAILKRKPLLSCRPIILDADKELVSDVYEAVKKNPSPAYKAIEPEIPDHKEGETLIMVTGNGRDPNGEKRKLRW